MEKFRQTEIVVIAIDGKDYIFVTDLLRAETCRCGKTYAYKGIAFGSDVWISLACTSHLGKEFEQIHAEGQLPHNGVI